MTGRREFPTKVRVAAFQRSGGLCETCSGRLYVGKITYDHILPDWLGGEPTLANCQVLCSACDKVKTRADVGRIAKTKRVEARHTGAKAPSRNPLPGSRRSPWRKKINGEVVAR